MRSGIASLTALLFVGMVDASPSTAQGAQLPPSLELRVPKPPTLGRGNGASFLTYELHLTNLGVQPLTLKSVEVWPADGSRAALLSLSDSVMLQSLGRPGATVPQAERATLGGGLRAVVFVWIPLDGGAVPKALRHRVTVQTGAGDSVRTQSIDGPLVPVATAPVAIGPPLRGGPWLAANGPSNRSGHRRAMITTGGTAAIARRFAIDYVKLNDRNSTYDGDRLKNESYGAEGNDALAVADGRVVAVKDSIPENVPGVNSRAVPITLGTVGGNHVILDLGGGHYAFYAHLKPGSVRVHVGDRVRRGQVVGLVGNSGNSTEPHLHFHISDANSPLGSEGEPYALDSFELVGACSSFTECTPGAPQPRHGEMPMQNTLVRFP
jgi:murein DD-endopeptidase